MLRALHILHLIRACPPLYIAPLVALLKPADLPLSSVSHLAIRVPIA
jgi:hypothetical protein